MQPLRCLAAAALAALSLTAHAVGSLAQISVYDRVARQALPVYWHEGQAYVVGRPGNEYQVMVRNRAGEDLLAIVSVDGVNVMSGETAATLQGGYVISRGDRLDIRGWRKSLGEIAAFYFTSLGDSYAARTGRPDNVGVIGVALFKRRPPEPLPFSDSAPYSRNEESYDKSRNAPGAPATTPPPARPGPGEPAAQARQRGLYADPAAPLGTGHGRRESSPMRWVSFDRASDEPVEIITLHYDSYRNLVAHGILDAPPAPRDPNPFPGFVADPPSGRYF